MTTCAHYACPNPARRRGVCPKHWDLMVRAGRRASRHAPRERATAVTAEMRAA